MGLLYVLSLLFIIIIIIIITHQIGVSTEPADHENHCWQMAQNPVQRTKQSLTPG